MRDKIEKIIGYTVVIVGLGFGFYAIVWFSIFLFSQEHIKEW